MAYRNENDSPFSEVNMNFELFQINAKYRQIQGRTALQVAAYKGQVEIVRFLLSKGAKISTSDDDGDGALHFAMLRYLVGWWPSQFTLLWFRNQ